MKISSHIDIKAMDSRITIQLSWSIDGDCDRVIATESQLCLQRPLTPCKKSEKMFRGSFPTTNERANFGPNFVHFALIS